MADTKISALPAATTPLAGTEVLPIVQSGATVKVSVDNLTTGKAVSVASLTDSGNLTFTGTGNRITGDFSNATVANRVAFQTSTANTSTIVSAFPSGTGTASRFEMYSNSDGTNASTLQLTMFGTVDARLLSGITGTGTYLPMTFYTGGSERVRVDTSGNVGIGTISPTVKLDVVGTVKASTSLLTPGAIYSDDGTTISRVVSSGGVSYWGTTSNHPVVYQTNNQERLRITSAGDVGIGAVSPFSRLNVSQSSADTSAYFNGSRLTITNSSATAGNFDTLSFTTANGNDAAAIWTVIGSHTASAATGTLVFGTTNASSVATERMRLDSSGNLISSAPTTPPTLTTNGTMVFNLTSNTNLRVSVRGSDGVTRTANLTLS